MDNRSDDQSRRGSHQDDSEDESEILEESPCGRWQKRKEEVDRCIPGIDATFLAMDMEEGVEVVWNEVNLENWDLKQSKVREEKIKAALDQLIQLDHPNIVKLHKYWTDIRDEKKARVIFITEYMSSGSLKQFLVKTKRNVIKMALPAWKRWCTQLLSALCYMHSASPPIIHGNLSCDTICISHTGIIKIDAVAPNAIQRSLRWTRDDPPANLHFVAPEIGHCKDEVNCYVSPFPAPLTAAMDIYSFGICALEMAALEIPVAESNQVTQKIVLKTIDSLDNSLQRDFIKACISVLPSKRPSARKLLFHPVLFEVPSLRLLAAHMLVNNTPSYQPEQLTDEALQKSSDPETVLAEYRYSNGTVVSRIRYCDVPKREVESFLEEVKHGTYPLTALRPTYNKPVVSRHRNSPELTDSIETFDEETRRILNLDCELLYCPNNAACTGMSLHMKMDDQMNRQINCDNQSLDPLAVTKLVEELVRFGLIHYDDRDIVKNAINHKLERSSEGTGSVSAS